MVAEEKVGRQVDADGARPVRECMLVARRFGLHRHVVEQDVDATAHAFACLFDLER